MSIFTDNINNGLINTFQEAKDFLTIERVTQREALRASYSHILPKDNGMRLQDINYKIHELVDPSYKYLSDRTDSYSPHNWANRNAVNYTAQCFAESDVNDRGKGWINRNSGFHSYVDGGYEKAKQELDTLRNRTIIEALEIIRIKETEMSNISEKVKAIETENSELKQKIKDQEDLEHEIIDLRAEINRQNSEIERLKSQKENLTKQRDWLVNNKFEEFWNSNQA